MSSKNIDMIQTVASGLGGLVNEVVFVGGSVLELYIDTVTSEPSRPTLDVDLVIHVTNRTGFYLFGEKLRLIGFVNNISEGAPICRWTYHNVIVDIMPSNESILWFSNKWYEYGFSRRVEKSIGNDISIFLFPVVVYLATKIEAILQRGLPDIRYSHDFEDVIFLIDNCNSLLVDFENSDKDVKKYISNQFQILMQMDIFREAVNCVLPYGSDYNDVERIVQKLRHFQK